MRKEDLAPNHIFVSADGEVIMPDKLDVNHEAWVRFFQESHRLAALARKREEGREAGLPCRCGHVPAQHHPEQRCSAEGCKCHWYDP